MDNNIEHRMVEDVEVVITSYNQGKMIFEAVHSVCEGTVLPSRILIVDDGSTDKASLDILKEIQNDDSLPVVVEVIHQANGGVSAARNTGIRNTDKPFVLVLDGDDKIMPAYVEKVYGLLKENTAMVAASSWMHTFGVMDAIICPTGGTIGHFLSHNCCPATHMLRREAWQKCGGHDESMRSGFEDWDFFLRMLETAEGAFIGIVDEPLIAYRTAPASSNVRSMSKRIELMRYLIRKHHQSYQEHIEDAVLGIETISMTRLNGWEDEICHTLKDNRQLCKTSSDFMHSPSYGDGGMAAAVRIVSSTSEK